MKRMRKLPLLKIIYSRVVRNRIWKKSKPFIRRYDMVEGMLQINFNMLVCFVEHGDMDLVDWQYDMEHQNAHRSIMKLYHWWTRLREKHNGKIDDIWGCLLDKYPLEYHKEKAGVRVEFTIPGELSEKHRRMRDWFDLLEQRKLEELVKLRQWLWT